MWKLIVLNMIGAIALIVCYSDMFLGLSISDHNVFCATCAIMVAPTVIVGLIWYDGRKLMKRDMTIDEADDSEDMEYLLDKYRSTLFAKQSSILKGQLRLFGKREQVFLIVLEENDLKDAGVFPELIAHLEKQILLNAQKALRIMQVFNYDRFRTQGKNADSAYYDQIRTCNAYIETNEQILTQFDALISEISRVREEQGDDSIQRAADMAATLQQIRMANGDEISLKELERKYG